jgi:hypothetical protein
MDLRGYHATQEAGSDTRTGTLLSLFGCLVWLVPFLLLLCCVLPIGFGTGP